MTINLNANTISSIVAIVVTLFMFVCMIWFPMVLLNTFIGILALAASAFVGISVGAGLHSLLEKDENSSE